MIRTRTFTEGIDCKRGENVRDVMADFLMRNLRLFDACTHHTFAPEFMDINDGAGYQLTQVGVVFYSIRDNDFNITEKNNG